MAATSPSAEPETSDRVLTGLTADGTVWTAAMASPTCRDFHTLSAVRMANSKFSLRSMEATEDLTNGGSILLHLALTPIAQQQLTSGFLSLHSNWINFLAACDGFMSGVMTMSMAMSQSLSGLGPWSSNSRDLHS